MKTLKEHFENGELENLPKLVQESVNLEYGENNVYVSAVNDKNLRISDCTGWFSEGLTKEELNQLEKPSEEHILDFISQGCVNLSDYTLADQVIILDYAEKVLTQILINDKN